MWSRHVDFLLELRSSLNNTEEGTRFGVPPFSSGVVEGRAGPQSWIMGVVKRRVWAVFADFRAPTLFARRNGVSRLERGGFPVSSVHPVRGECSRS